jgi:hypothetical protein
MDRRTFLVTVVGTALLGNKAARAFGERTIGNLGVQLYTIRDFMQQDFDGSLAKVEAAAQPINKLDDLNPLWGMRTGSLARISTQFS